MCIIRIHAALTAAGVSVGFSLALLAKLVLAVSTFGKFSQLLDLDRLTLVALDKTLLARLSLKNFAGLEQ